MCSNGCVRFISTRMAIQLQRTTSRRESHRCSCGWSIRWLDRSFSTLLFYFSLSVQAVISLRWSWPKEIIPWKWIVFWTNWVQKSVLVERRFQRRTATMSKSNNGLVSLIIIPIVNYRQFNLRQRKRHKWTQPSVSKQRMKDRWTYIEFISSVAIRQTGVRVCFVSQIERFSSAVDKLLSLMMFHVSLCKWERSTRSLWSDTDRSIIRDNRRTRWHCLSSPTAKKDNYLLSTIARMRQRCFF